MHGTTELVESDEIEASMTQSDRVEINGLITASEQRIKAKRWPEWLKESIVPTIVLGGCGFIVYTYIPAQIGSQTSAMASDISSLKTSAATIQKDLADVKKDIEEGHQGYSEPRAGSGPSRAAAY